MMLYHFTSDRHINGISHYGLTVGDVPTSATRGRVGVWFTTAETSAGHGLGGAADKTRFRLGVDLDSRHPCLHKWTEWAPANVDGGMLKGLHKTAENYRSWYVFFGVIPPEKILSCIDMSTGQEVDWRHHPTSPLDLPGVPKWRRESWHRSLLRHVARAIAVNHCGLCPQPTRERRASSPA